MLACVRDELKLSRRRNHDGSLPAIGLFWVIMELSRTQSPADLNPRVGGSIPPLATTGSVCPFHTGPCRAPLMRPEWSRMAQRLAIDTGRTGAHPLSGCRSARKKGGFDSFRVDRYVHFGFHPALLCTPHESASLLSIIGARSGVESVARDDRTVSGTPSIHRASFVSTPTGAAPTSRSPRKKRTQIADRSSNAKSATQTITTLLPVRNGAAHRAEKNAA